MSRVPHADDHDLFVGLETGRAVPRVAYAIAKQTFRIGDAGLELIDVRPLRHDLATMRSEQKLPRGSDFWWQKQRTDVVVEGAAWAPGGRPVSRAEVVCRVGAREKRIAVIGRRFVEYSSSGRAYASPPEPFSAIPLDDEHAYGGFDPRVPFVFSSDPRELVAELGDHPGFYPRNPVGRGYLVMPERTEGVELPNLEDPDDLLDDDRLVVGDPAGWHRQPLPWTLGWQHAMALTRLSHLGLDAHTPLAAAAELTEVQRGYLPVDYRGRERPGFHQEASLGMTFEPLAAGTPIVLSGVHRERHEIRFDIPPAPSLSVEVEGTNHAEARLTGVVIEPDTERVSFVYAAVMTAMPRLFKPGVHAHIPLSARLSSGPPCVYETPAIAHTLDPT